MPARNLSSHSADSAGIARGSSNAASLPTLTMIASSDERGQAIDRVVERTGVSRRTNTIKTLPPSAARSVVVRAVLTPVLPFVEFD